MNTDIVLGARVLAVYETLPAPVKAAIEENINTRRLVCSELRAPFDRRAILAELVNDARDLLGKRPARVSESSYIAKVVVPAVKPAARSKFDILDDLRQSYGVYQAPADAKF